MAQQADGTVYINSSIDTDGFTAGGKEIEAAARRAAKTVKGIGDSARIALEKQTAAFIKSNQLYAQQEQKVQDLQNKLEEMAGQTVETTAFKEIQKQIDTDTTKLNRLIQTQEEFLATGGKESSTAYQRRQMQIEELRNSIEHAKAEQDELLSSGGAYQPVDTSAVEQKLVDARERLLQMNNSLNISYDALKSKVEQYNGTIAETVAKEDSMRKGLGSLTNNIKEAGSAMLTLHKNTEKSNGSMGYGVKNVLKYAFGISTLFSLVNKFRNAIKKAIKEGFSNLYENNERFKNSVDGLNSSLLTLKNALAAAFAPIIETVIPYIQRFVEWMTKAVNLLGQFIAALTGRKTYTKAIKQTAKASDDAAKATKKETEAMEEAQEAAQDYLSPLDEISRYSEDKSKNLKSPIADIEDTPADGIANMFEEIPIDSRILDWLEKIKNFLKPILDYLNKLKDIFMQGFWDGLGDWEYRWESIKNSLASIKDSLIDIFTDPAVLAAADKYVKSVAYMLGSLIGSISSIGLTIADNLLGGIAKYLDQNKDRIKQYLISMFEIKSEINYMFADLFQAIAYVFEAFASKNGKQLTANIIGIFADAFMGISELALKLTRDIAQLFIKPFVDNKEAFRTALEGFLGVLMEVTGTIKQGIDDTFDKLNEVYDTHFKPFFDSVAQGLSGLIAKFMEFWNGNVQPILDQMAADFDALWQAHIQPLLNNAAEFLGKIADLLKALWENILQPLIAWIIENVLPKILPVIQAIWDRMVNFVGYIADAINSIITIFGGIIDFLTGIFTGDWDLAFQGLESIVSGFVDLITGIIEGFFSLIRDTLNIFIEAVKSAISVFGQAIVDLAKKFLDTVKSNVVDKFAEITQKIQDFINGAKEKWNSGWDALKEKVKSIIEEIKNAIQAAFDWISEKVNAIAEKLSSVKDSAKSIFSKGTSFVSSIFTSKYISTPSIPNMPSIPVIETPQIPYLASGAVIPPNAPFAAILGDQKNGKNLELPENLLRKIVREESGSNQGFNGTIRIPLTIGGRQILEAVITAAQLQQMMDGRNPFEMA